MFRELPPLGVTSQLVENPRADAWVPFARAVHFGEVAWALYRSESSTDWPIAVALVFIRPKFIILVMAPDEDAIASTPMESMTIAISTSTIVKPPLEDRFIASPSRIRR